ncbi:MAG: ABC transporter permease [Rhodanobacteraceae bacterium]|nr:ABC transporter permease [Pseudomonadota bacterium]
MKTAAIVFMKEVRENLRDRRTVLNTCITGPLMAPLIFVLVIHFAIAKQVEQAEKPLPVSVIDARYAPNLVEALKQLGMEAKPPMANPEAAVRAQEANVVLRIPAAYGNAWRKGEPAQVELIYDASQSDSAQAEARLEQMLKGLGQRTASLRLLARGLSPALAPPIAIAERDQSTPQSRGGLLFAMLPYFFILAAFVGGTALAIDTTAGERERQSLEPLFANPVPRWQILAGKLGATSLFSLVTVLLSIIAFAQVGHFLPADKLGMVLDLGARFTITVLVAMLPLVLLLAAAQTLVAAFARTYREAQTYLTLLTFLPAIPSILLSILPFKAKLWMYAIPVVGQQTVILRLMRGETVAGTPLAVCVVCTTIAALVVCAITARVYQSERLAISA